MYCVVLIAVLGSTWPTDCRLVPLVKEKEKSGTEGSDPKSPRTEVLRVQCVATHRISR